MSLGYVPEANILRALRKHVQDVNVEKSTTYDPEWC